MCKKEGKIKNVHIFNASACDQMERLIGVSPVVKKKRKEKNPQYLTRLPVPWVRGCLHGYKKEKKKNGKKPCNNLTRLRVPRGTSIFG